MVRWRNYFDFGGSLYASLEEENDEVDSGAARNVGPYEDSEHNSSDHESSVEDAADRLKRIHAWMSSRS